MAIEGGECEPTLFNVFLTEEVGGVPRAVRREVQVLGCQHNFVSSQRIDDGHASIQGLGIDYGVLGAVENHHTILD